jgi:hypothetical protein
MGSTSTSALYWRRNFVGKPFVKWLRIIKRPRRRWKSNMKMNVRDLGYEDMMTTFGVCAIETSASLFRELVV